MTNSTRAPPSARIAAAYRTTEGEDMAEAAPEKTTDTALVALQAALTDAKLVQLTDEEAGELASALGAHGWVYLGKIPARSS